MLGYTHTPPEQTPREQTPPWSRHPQSRHPRSRPPRSSLPPPEQTPPRAHTPRAHTPHGSRHPQSRHPPEQTPPPRSRQPPPEQTPPKSRPPHRRACWEIRSTRGRFASYWNAILFLVAFTLIHKYHNILFIVAKKTRDNTLRFKKYSGIRVLGPAGYRMRISLLGYQCTKISSPRKDLIAPT